MTFDNLVEPLGIEPSPDALQASARTLYAKVPDVKKAAFATLTLIHPEISND
ncbi:hypothetical protein XBKB1_3610006 [Xenorhabdus bovienii str. kraussei Becker Underwood]|uniref:Uncharacterized protein n=1 Tax=Xenorhabdus bovienii str. kraussei Becker Underwood TaxID=1398204 RepID=A0A077PWL7_XENBV|nr:hypothetical protein XBKB1_3610006 [Xenorhabdus bovienii str. kraussei Becker Underwood]